MIFDSLAQHINVIQDTMQRQVAHAINRGLTVRNWLIGCYIVEFEQHGEDRAAYGEQLLKRLEQANPALMPAESTEVVVSNEKRIRHTVPAELQTIETGGVLSPLDPFKIFNRLSYTHMIRLSKKYMLQLPTEEDIRKYIMSKSRTI